MTDNKRKDKEKDPSNQGSKYVGIGLVSAIAASLCCITPVLALLAGASGVASIFSWLDPLRPIFLGLTVVVLGFAWYLKLKPRTPEEIACACEEDSKVSLWQSKKFLGIITIFAGLMMSFPYYASVFYAETVATAVNVEAQNIRVVDLKVKGMTCEGCEEHVKHAIHELPGIISTMVSHINESAHVQFDQSSTDVKSIIEAVNRTGYTVISSREGQEGGQ